MKLQKLDNQIKYRVGFRQIISKLQLNSEIISTGIKQLHYIIQRIFMSIQKLPEEKTESSLCNSCHSFYGTQATDWLCSSCYKKGKTNKCQETSVESKVQIKAPVVEKIEEKKEQVKQDLQKDRKKCFACSKKVGLLGTQCKCTFVFCNAHRLPEAHKCEFNFREKGIKELVKTVIKVDKGKIAQI